MLMPQICEQLDFIVSKSNGSNQKASASNFDQINQLTTVSLC